MKEIVLEAFDPSFIKLPDRSNVTNKGDCGRLLVIGGNIGMAGAVSFAAEAAYRSGCGLVEVLTHPENRVVIQTLIPEAIVSFWNDFDFSDINSYSAIVLGMGMGKNPDAARIVDRIIASSKIPTVVDADALNIISLNKELLKYCNKNTILTPHLGEFSRLIGAPVDKIKNRKEAISREFAANNGTNLLLKDSVSITALASGALIANASGNSALSKGGSGDILAGVIGSLLAQGMTIDEALPAAVYIHGIAGERAGDVWGIRGALARDVIKELPLVIREF